MIAKPLLHAVQSVLAADLACSPSAFETDHIQICEAERREGRFRFPFREKSLNIVTMGRGAVISCDKGKVGWMTEHLSGLDRGQLYSIQTLSKLEALVNRDKQYIAGPDQKYVCTRAELNDVYIPNDISVTTFYGNDVQAAYVHKGFNHALGYRVDSPRPDMICTVAEHNGIVAGIAGASADCETMWQIGVDVAPHFQGRGIGRALVGTVARAIWKEGIIPYYSTEISNLRSRQLAVSLGFWPAWIQLYARDS